MTAQRRAPAAVGTGVPADRHEAYRRGLCRDCMTAWHSPGGTRCDDCHEIYAAVRGIATQGCDQVPSAQPSHASPGPARPPRAPRVVAGHEVPESRLRPRNTARRGRLGR